MNPWRAGESLNFAYLVNFASGPGKSHYGPKNNSLSILVSEVGVWLRNTDIYWFKKLQNLIFTNLLKLPGPENP